MTRNHSALGGLLALVAAVGGTACVPGGDMASHQNAAAQDAARNAQASSYDPSTVGHTTQAPAHAATHAPADHPQLRYVLNRLTTKDGGPGALVALRDRSGGEVLTSGVADVQNQAPMRGDGRFRIGSMTKPFVATVMLQLVGEGRVALDAHVERYLPGVVRGHGNDGREITVRELLQHTSGLPDYLDYLKPEDVLNNPRAHYDARHLVRLALAHPRAFEPGTDWSYSNTGYLVAGMIIERVTGRTYGDEIRRRIIEPLGLRQTSVPHGDDTAIRGPHPRGYARPGKDAPLKDITALNPTITGASGSMISSGADLDRFLDALVRGKLLAPTGLRQMMKTRPTGSPDGGAYGLGLESHPLPCGGLAWGHDGGVPGYQAVGAATVDGRQATAMVNLYPGGTQAQNDDMMAAVRTGLCEGRSSR
ncbi:D-alanyl-D-alanine carboxypeptidase [Streptomyces hundungensis]|uniref:D-alanyl-D-alanine carboxypeptidase n=1 Tax=Streptomyces hundungensis TaxID=1077946 RepID=A0A387HS84_9ACTN|nr:serine hydrolase domain-containing protein [Streptomyces hundungensis]AYG84970.1 D-alanyl-D-alanine carboxypeptidase [Streptomyces hundungensis]